MKYIKCSACGKRSIFHNSEEDCRRCGMKCRSNGLYRRIKDRVTSDSYIYEPQTFGKIHDMFIAYPNYICSDYMSGVKSGEIVNGVLIEDIQNTSFADDTFDFIILQDVLEHVVDYKEAINEMKRVLKPDASLLISIPLEGATTKVVAHYEGDTLIYDEPPRYHDDFNSQQTSLVFTKFSHDFIYIINKMFKKCYVLPFEFGNVLLIEVVK